MYTIGPDGVGVSVGANVSVTVGVAVGGRGVLVTVGVGVFDAKKPGNAGGESPVNQRITKKIPTTSRTIANPPRISGTNRSFRFR